MNVRDLERLFDYGWSADRKLFAVLAGLTDEELTRTVAGSYGSVRNTLVHVMSAEWGWIERCGGAARGERLNGERYPTARSIADEWARVEAHGRALLASLADADLARPVTFDLGEGPQVATLGDLLLHAVIHGAHHRGQVSLLLRELGHAPGNFDYLFYASAAA